MELRQSLINVAYKLFLKYGVKSVSMDDIAGKLGVSKKTIYCNVSNKDALIDIVVDKYICDDKEKIENIIKQSENAIEEIIHISIHGINFMQDMAPSLMMDLQKYHHDTWIKITKDHFHYIEKMIEDNLLRGQNEGFFRTDLNQKIISRVHASLILNLFTTDELISDQIDKVTLYKEIVKYHIFSIVNDKGKQYFTQKNFLNSIYE
ncbi:MAG: TetR/AcrR family transcriptional regulator [Saprospiraceae bacterium]